MNKGVFCNDKMTHFIIVLGCSKVLTNGNKQKYTPRSHAYGRLMKTAEVYNSIQDPDKIIICSGGFGQANKMKKYLIELNIETDFFVEPFSRNTIENCIFSYELISKWLMSNEERKDFHIHIVTDDYHIKRSEIIFKFFINRLPYYVQSFSCHGSFFLNYLEDIYESDREEIEKAYLNDRNIIELKLNNSLIEYQNWYPINKDYNARI